MIDDKAEKAEKAKLGKKYQAAVAKMAKKLVANLIETEIAECAAADLSLKAAIKRRGGSVGKVSAMSVIEDEDAVAEKEIAQKQATIKLSSVKSRINKLKKDVPFEG